MSAACERRIAAAGVELRARIEGEGEPILVVHGFTGRSESMAPVAAGLRDERRVLRVDLVGHGESEAPRARAPYTMECCVAQLTACLDALELPRVDLLGYSMGGRAALALAAAQPGRVRSAVLVGASAGLADAAQRAARIRDDEALADEIEREGLEPFVERWLALPLFASQARLGPEFLAAARAERLRNRPWGLANSLRGMGSGAQPPLHDALPRIAAPVLLVAGALDAKFQAIARDLAARLPRASVATVADAGHACHLEQPEAFLRVVREFLGGPAQQPGHSVSGADSAAAGARP